MSCSDESAAVAPSYNEDYYSNAIALPVLSSISCIAISSELNEYDDNTLKAFPEFLI